MVQHLGSYELKHEWFRKVDAHRTGIVDKQARSGETAASDKTQVAFHERPHRTSIGRLRRMTEGANRLIVAVHPYIRLSVGARVRFAPSVL
jgi:hypothetical protein